MIILKTHMWPVIFKRMNFASENLAGIFRSSTSGEGFPAAAQPLHLRVVTVTGRKTRIFNRDLNSVS